LDIGCVRLSNGLLALAVHEECCTWTRALGAAMRELDGAAVVALREGMAANHAVLQQTPEDLAQLKGVLHVINSVRCGGGGLRPVLLCCMHRGLALLLLAGLTPRPRCCCRSGGMQMELQCVDLVERYRTRLLYAIADTEKAAAAEELDDVALLPVQWADLCRTADAVDEQLEAVKRKFSRITRQQVGLTAGARGGGAFTHECSEAGQVLQQVHGA
jgi:hypothetical protein